MPITGYSNTISVTTTIDADALAYINALAADGYPLEAPEQTYINTLVTDFKSAGIWSKMKAIYPYCTSQRNIFGYTTTLANGYTTDGSATFTLNSTTAPDGTNTGIKFTAVGSNNNYYYVNNTNWGNNFPLGNNVYSIYVKAGTFSGSAGIAIMSDGSYNRTTFTLTNEWQRIQVTRNVSGYASLYYLDLWSQTMASGEYFYIWAPQYETGTTATTYQPVATTASTIFASQFKYNLKDPRNLDAAFRQVFNGGWTYSKQGATPNGTNGYADTKLVPSSVLTNANNHVSAYSRTQYLTPIAKDQNLWGSLNAANYLSGDIYNNTPKIYTTNGAANFIDATISNTQGLFTTSIVNTSTNGQKTYQNNLVKGTNTNSTATLPSVSLYLAALNNNGGSQNFSPFQTAFVSIGDGLSDTEVSAMYTSVQSYQTSMQRQV